MAGLRLLSTVSITLLIVLLLFVSDGQSLVQSVTIEPVNGSQLIVQSGESRSLTCKISLERRTALIYFFQTGYEDRPITQPMMVENPYACEDEGDTTLCYRVAVINESMKNQVIQCAFRVDEEVFFSQSIIVTVVYNESTPSPTPKITTSSPSVPACTDIRTSPNSGAALLQSMTYMTLLLANLCQL